MLENGSKNVDDGIQLADAIWLNQKVLESSIDILTANIETWHQGVDIPLQAEGENTRAQQLQQLPIHRTALPSGALERRWSEWR